MLCGENKMQMQARVRALYARIGELHRQGHSWEIIATMVGVSRRTVFRALAAKRPNRLKAEAAPDPS